MAKQQHEKIGLAEKLGYGVGDLASGLYLNFFGVFLFYYFVELGGVAPAAIVLMLLISKLIDAVTDPMMGAIADRTRTRWGRYRPYLLFGAIPFGATGVLVFALPDLAPGPALAWAYVTYGLAMLAYTAVNVPYSGLLGVISPSASERASVTAFRMVFSSLAGIMLGVLGTTLVRELGGGDEARGILLTMVCIAVLGALCIYASFATTKERIPPAPVNGTVWGDVRVLVRTGPWLAVAAAAILAVLAIASRAASAKFWFKYVAGDDGTPVFLFLDRLGLFLTTLALGQITGVILGNQLQKRFEKRDLIIAAGLLKLTAIMLFYLMPLDAVWPQTLVQYFVGIGFGVLMVCAFSMFTDIAEYVDWKSGLQMTGLVVSASIFAVKVGVGLGSAMPGFAMGLTGFDVTDGLGQSPAALWGVEAAFALIPAAALVPAAIAMLFYRLDRKTIAQLEEELSARRAPTG
ncbi:glycoside-pentoside-hexuronide (GPH):cation symporter [Erythrobacter sp. SDW2]|uniref:MFS transporter n=1 Tax=Erythrobacter sp. SDW2 TaxID=2907154 RepID=UPI001F1FE88D|nr:glycoside-pentoside-hexuronide (GPH):cation symporter [Erythrobacter sp. SDW2]UIP08015.1 glycoside-pentoside-hexuronide (GPH):cation symporter [Erythrobacter sp. SDW2]